MRPAVGHLRSGEADGTIAIRTEMRAQAAHLDVGRIPDPLRLNGLYACF